MNENNFANIPLTYLNPVYQKSFPDPYILKFRGEYFAYCTDFWHDGKVFGVLQSRDLINWKEIGGAMQPLENSPPFYWAPEVTYYNGKFYLYYSVGNEKLMEIRVAVSAQPWGNFVDCGKRLTNEEFAIDPHVFTDENGERFLFYATDFLEYSHIGTGTVVDRLKDFFALAGDPKPVTRAKYDWQVYDTNRKEKGGVRWHTIEGSFVLKRKGFYYQMFSGGNWQNVTYGVSFATTENIETNEEWYQFSDGEKVFPILRTIPGKVTGPGHNSVVRGLNNRELFCIYHCWTQNGRVLAIDRVDFTGGERLFIFGATTSPQFAPYQPEVLDFFDDFSEEIWKIRSGNWFIRDNQIISEAVEISELECQLQHSSFLLEISLRLIEDETGKFGIYLNQNREKIGEFLLDSNRKKIIFNYLENGLSKSEDYELPSDFDFYSFQLLKIEVDHWLVKISLDGQVLKIKKIIKNPISNFSLAAENCQAAFSGAAVTIGFENLFEDNDFEVIGWRLVHGNWEINDKNLILNGQEGDETIIEKKIFGEDFEIAFNFCLLKVFNKDFNFGLSLGLNELNKTVFNFTIKNDSEWILQKIDSEKVKQISLPNLFLTNNFHQISLIKIGDELFFRSETEELGKIRFSQLTKRVAFFVQHSILAFDMIRQTTL